MFRKLVVSTLALTLAVCIHVSAHIAYRGQTPNDHHHREDSGTLIMHLDSASGHTGHNRRTAHHHHAYAHEHPTINSKRLEHTQGSFPEGNHSHVFSHTHDTTSVTETIEHVITHEGREFKTNSDYVIFQVDSHTHGLDNPDNYHRVLQDVTHLPAEDADNNGIADNEDPDTDKNRKGRTARAKFLKAIADGKSREDAIAAADDAFNDDEAVKEQVANENAVPESFKIGQAQADAQYGTIPAPTVHCEVDNHYDLEHSHRVMVIVGRQRIVRQHRHWHSKFEAESHHGRVQIDRDGNWDNHSANAPSFTCGGGANAPSNPYKQPINLRSNTLVTTWGALKKAY